MLEAFNKITVICFLLSLAFLASCTTLERPFKTPAQSQMQLLAHSGDVKSQYGLGLAYENGDGVKQNLDRAVEWYHKAADSGLAAAQFKLGSMHFNGRGVSENHEQAFRWFRKSAEQGNANAQYKLGNMYYYGQYVPKDMKEATNWWLKSGDQGHKDSQALLGATYMRASQGAAYNVAELQSIYEAIGNDRYRNEALAFDWALKAAMQGHKVAQHQLGFMYAYKSDDALDKQHAEYWMYKSAVQGYAKAQVYLGGHYRLTYLRSKRQDLDPDPNDYAKSAYWYLEAAKQGDAKGAFEASNLNKENYGAKISEEDALAWLIKSAKQGYDRAQTRLAWRYDKGTDGFDVNEELAIYWYRKAAEQGYTVAEIQLGKKYAQGIGGVRQNKEEAVYWFKRAAKDGNGEAKRLLKEVQE